MTRFDREHKAFNVFLVYPNIQQCALMPYSMGLFTSILRNDGFNVDLFDSTFYLDDANKNYDHYQTAVKEFDWAERKVRFKKTSMLNAFRKKVEDFEPDVIAMSVVENTYPVGKRLIQSLPEKYRKLPIIWGGVFATFAPEIILKDDVGNYVCRGEGEIALLEFCRRACSGKSLNDIPNIYAKENNNLYKNPLGPAVNLDELPFPDYSLFEEQAIYRPMQGKIWRTIGVESQRGCPYLCTFCNSPSQVALAKDEQGSVFYRKKSWKRVHEEITYLKQTHDMELIYWLVDTFLALSNYEFDEMVEMYRDFKIPFWMNTRAETVTDHRADGLEEMNMLRMSVGIEHGNAEYRETMLKRRVSNDTMLKAFRSCAGRSFTTNGNCIIGMPRETRQLVFDTIEFSRQLPVDVEKTGAFTFAPYHGTALRRIAEDDGYLDPNTICDISDPTASMLDQPGFPRSEVIGLARTFGLYQSLPKSEWKWIEVAEKDTEEGRKMFEQLQKQHHIINAQARLDEGQTAPPSV